MARQMPRPNGNATVTRVKAVRNWGREGAPPPPPPSWLQGIIMIQPTMAQISPPIRRILSSTLGDPFISPPPPPKDIPRFFLGADSTASAIAHSKFAPPAPTKRRLACVSSHPNHSWGGVGDVGVGWGGGGCRGGGGAVGGCTGGGVRVGDVGVGDVGMESVGVGGVGVGAAWGEVDGVCREER